VSAAAPSSLLARSFLPATAVLEMTYACNHACRFCSCPWEAEGNGFTRRPELSVDEWKQCIDLLAGMGCTIFSFTGGEALLKPGIEEIIAFAASRECEHIEPGGDGLRRRVGPPSLYLLSNGAPVTREVLSFCQEFGIHLSLSLPGLGTYTYHTQADDAQMVLERFRLAKRMKVSTTVNTAVTRRNLPELWETIAEAMSAGAGSLLMNRFLPGGRGLTYADDLSLAPTDLLTMLDTAEDVLERCKRPGHLGTEVPKCLVDPSRYSRLHVGTTCAAATGFFVIGPSGYVRVCNHSPVELAHYGHIESLKTDPYWRRFALKAYLPKQCLSCTEIGRCDGGCREAAHIVGGEVDSIDPMLCAQPSERFPLSPASASGLRGC